ncbi:MAG: glycosyltransferase family 39 protein [Candidatus Daviesbacteria bacterium]|nr:glycosyltransferase family 39 protein [Candidatus Daviesbacteria bacterium]
MFLFLIIFALGIFLRVWKLPEFPIQLNHDEVSQAYDAISIVQTGKDIYGNFLPTIFPSVGDFKSPFYTYATSLTYFLIGNHEWMIRVPGVIFGILIIPAVFWFTLKLTKESKIALFASFFTAISPSEIFFSRKSFENGAGIFFLFVAVSCLLTYLENQKHQKWLYLTAFLSALGMYTYFSHAIIIPLMLVTFILIFRKKFTQGIEKYLLAFLLWILLIIPLVIIISTNPGSRFRSQTVFITQDSILARQLEYAKSENSIISNFQNFKTIGDFSFNRYFGQFDPAYLFGNGLDLTNQGPVNMGPLFLFQLPLLLIAIFYLIQRVEFANPGRLLVFLIALGAIPSGLTFEPHSPHRMIIVFTILNIITGIGAYYLWQRINRLNVPVKLITILVLAAILTMNVAYFIHIYFANYPYEKSQYIQYPFKQVAQFAWSQHENFDLIVFDPLFGEVVPFIGTGAHYYLAYFGNFPPAKFQNEYRKGEKEREVLFDKFSIRKIDWREDQNLKKVLFVGSPWSLPIQTIDKNKILKTFYFYNGQPAFYAVKL